MNLTLKNSNVSDHTGLYGDVVQVQCDYGHSVSAIDWTQTSFQATCMGDYVWDIHEHVLMALVSNDEAQLMSALEIMNTCDSKLIVFLSYNAFITSNHH